jgi:uncharacterized membrane protein YphA (DoxX/SURF4 family)
VLVRLLVWASRIVLGGLFIYAGFTKLQHRYLFEVTVDTYQLLPSWGVIVVAAVLPWLEIALGLLLLAGWKLRYVAAFTGLLLGAFLVAMGITYARGIEANCGCFGFGEPITPRSLARDSGLLLMAVFLAVTAWRARQTATAS